MIHPINFPEDLLASNPRRPQFFRPRPKLKISYGPDGRRLGPDGSALEPISPNSYWADTFMRTFIRRLVPEELARKEGAEEGPTHVDIVDLSPSASSAEEQQQPRKSEESGEDEENGRKDSILSTTSSGSSSSSPEKPSPELSTEEEEAEGDGLVEMGANAKIHPREERSLSQRISRRAIRAILKGCCPRGKEDKMEEFARLDFSHLKLFGEETERELELFPGKKGCRLWPCRRRKQVQFKEDQQKEEEEKKPHIRFHIASVRIRPSKEVAICLRAHNSLPEKVQFQVQTHLHKAQGEKIGKCIRFLEQVERLEPGKETSIHVKIALTGADGEVQGPMAGEVDEDNEEEGHFLMATMHGKVIG